MRLSLALKKKSSSKAMRRGRREDCELPLDLQAEILTRLPAITLMRFKCVSKLWSSLIRCRYFSNRYLKVASSLRPPEPPRLYMSLVDHDKFTTSTDLCQNPSESVLLSSSPSTFTGAKCFDQALTMPGIGGRNMVILRGLILYTVCRQACIYNPTTRQNITLPAVKSNIVFAQEFRKSVLYFLGHDPVLDQYKVVCTIVIFSADFKRMITSEHWVFVLLEGGGGSWKIIEFDQPHLPTKRGVCINGVIYYMASTGLSSRAIVSFDVRSEFQAPHVLPQLGKPVGFIEYSGKPAIVDHTKFATNGSLVLWVLEDDENWSRKSLVLKPRQRDLVSKCMTVEGTTLNGEVKHIEG